MKVRELLEQAVDKTALDAEVEAKFRKVFHIKGDKLELPADFDPWGEEGENLRQDFWYGVVEPGWVPKVLKGQSDDDADEMQQASQHRVAKKLGIPEDLIEV